MSRLHDKLSAIEGTAHVLARTDPPRFYTRRRARHRRSVIALGAVVLLGAAGLAVMLRAPSTPPPSAPVLPLPFESPLEPLRASELRDLAREATVLGSLAQAEELLKRAVALDHADASAWSDLGVVLVRRGEHWRGIEAIQRSVALNPKHAEAHRNLAVALDQNGQMFGAAAHYRAFLALAPPEHPDRGPIAERLTFLRTADKRR